MADPKSQIMDQVRQQAALNNARQLIEKVNEHCFERCVPKPSSSLSSSEQQCYSQCMEKYMQAWNTVSVQYTGHVRRSAEAAGSGGFRGL